MKSDNLLTEGNVFHVLLALSVPSPVVNVIQALYGAVDLIVVRWCCTPASVAAVPTGTWAAQIATSMVSGLALDDTILVGRYTGMKNEERTCRTIGTTLSAFVVVTSVLTVGMLIFRDTVLAALKTPATFMDEARRYVTICFCDIFFVCSYSAINAILRGYGDSRRPMYFVAVSCVLGIASDTTLVKYLGSSATSTALATILPQSISTIYSIVYPSRRKFIFTLTPKNLRIDRDRLKELAMVGVPIPPQECMVRLSFLYLTPVANRLGMNAVVAAGIASRYDVLAVLPATSIASALAAIMAQDYGVGKPERARRSLMVGVGFVVLASPVFFLWAQLSPQTMVGLFNTNPDIIEAGISFFHFCSLGYPTVSFVFCLNGFMNGRSKTVFTMVNCYFGALTLRMPLVWLAYTYRPDNLFAIGLITPAMLGFIVIYTMLFVIQQLRQDNSGRRKELTLRSV